MGFFSRGEAEKRQNEEDLDIILERALTTMVSGMDSLPKEYGIRFDASKMRDGPIRERFDRALEAFDESIRELELRESVAVDEDKKILTVLVKRVKSMRKQLASLRDVHEKISQLQDRSK